MGGDSSQMGGGQPRAERARGGVSPRALGALLAPLLMASCALLAVAGLAATGAGTPAAGAAPLANAVAMDTLTLSPPTETPTTVPASLALVSPASGEGPVGAHVTVAGTRWRGRTVVVTVARSSCDAPLVTATAAQPSPTGSFSATFIWPTAAGSVSTSYVLCAADEVGGAATGDRPYRVRSADPPTLSLSLPSVSVGQIVLVTGHNFFGVSGVALAINAGAGPHALATLTPDARSGVFSYTFVPDARDIGGVSLIASSTPDGAAPPALEASASLDVVGPLTPTADAPTAQPIATSSPTASGATLSSAGGDPSLPWVVALVALGILAMLALAGLVTWLALRVRVARAGAGYAAPGSGPRGANGGELVGIGVGRGAQLAAVGEPESSGPGAGWRPRPMSGALRGYPHSDYGYDPFDPDASPLRPLDPHALEHHAATDDWERLAGVEDDPTTAPGLYGQADLHEATDPGATTPQVTAPETPSPEATPAEATTETPPLPPAPTVDGDADAGHAEAASE